MQATFESLLREAIGLDSASIGSWTIERALQERIRACGLADPRAYLAHVRSSATELQALIEAVVVPETWFFRDRPAFAALVRFVHEAWLPSHPQGVLRLLSLPCSTGEEPYSLAIALLESGLPPGRFSIDAIDISARALAMAERATYGRNAFRSEDLGFRERHFTATPDGMRLCSRVRGQVRFRQGNLLAPGFRPAAEAYDAIFCRNLLIYFDRPTQDRAVGVLGQMLAKHGRLFVGPAETGLLLNHGFAPVRQSMAFAFRKAAAPATAPVHRDPVYRDPGYRDRLPPLPPRPGPPRSVPFQPVPPAPPAAGTDAVAGNLDEAMRLANQGGLAEAARLCEEHVRLHGASAQAFHLLGLIRDAEGNPHDAAQYYRKTLYLDRNHADALSHLALLMQKAGDAVAARGLRDRTQRRAADDARAP